MQKATPPKLDQMGADAPEAKGFDMDKAFNNGAFQEFIATHPDAGDKDNEANVEKLFRVFEKRNEVKKELRDLYKNKIKEEMGITLDANDLKSIDEHLDKKAFENPEEIIGLSDKTRRFKELPKEISDFEKELGRLGKAQDLDAQLDDLRGIETTKKYSGVIGKTKFAYQATSLGFRKMQVMFARKGSPHGKGSKHAEKVAGDSQEFADVRHDIGLTKEKYAKPRSWLPGKEIAKEDAQKLFADVESQIGAVEKSLARVTELEQLKTLSEESFGKIRKELLGNISGIAELTAAIQARARVQLEALTETGKDSFKLFNQAQDRFDALKKIGETTETGVNPIGDIKKEDFQRIVNETLEKTATDEILDAVSNAPVGDNAVTKLEKALEPFLKREKIGSKEGDEARGFIAKTLEDCAEKLGDTTQDKVKKVMIGRILSKIKK